MPAWIRVGRARMRGSSLVLPCALGGGVVPAAAQTAVLLESATLRATGQTGGTSITEAQFVGWRLEIDQAL